MFVQLFKSIIVMSAIGSVAALVLFLIKPVSRRLFGHKWQYYIYLIPLVILTVPLQLTLSQDIVPAKAQGVYHTVNSAVHYVSMQMSETGNVQMASNNAAAFKMPDLVQVLAITWIIGVVITFLTKIIKYLIFVNLLKRNSYQTDIPYDLPKRLEVRRTKMLDAPLMTGGLRPVLYLQETDDNIEAILSHELTHFKRNDILYKWYAMLTSCVHWFNPIVYLLLKEIDAQCEISCDCEATQKMNGSEKREYMSAILETAQKSLTSHTHLATHIAGDKKLLKKRFCAINTSHPLKRRAVFVGCVSSYVVGLVFFLSSAVVYGMCTDISSDLPKTTTAGYVFNSPAPAIVDDKPTMAITASPVPTKVPLVTQATQEPTAVITTAPTAQTAVPTVVPTTAQTAIPTAMPTEETFAPPTLSPAPDNEVTQSEISKIKTNCVSLEPYISFECFCFEENFSVSKLENILVRNGHYKTSSSSADLKSSYVSGSYDFKNGCFIELNNLKCDENGVITLYLNANANQLVEIIFTQTGAKEEDAGFGVIADNRYAYSFSGFDRDLTYTVTIQGATRSDWEIYGDYIIY